MYKLSRRAAISSSWRHNGPRRAKEGTPADPSPLSPLLPQPTAATSRHGLLLSGACFRASRALKGKFLKPSDFCSTNELRDSIDTKVYKAHVVSTCEAVLTNFQIQRDYENYFCLEGEEDRKLTTAGKRLKQMVACFEKTLPAGAMGSKQRRDFLDSQAWISSHDDKNFALESWDSVYPDLMISPMADCRTTLEVRNVSEVLAQIGRAFAVWDWSKSAFIRPGRDKGSTAASICQALLSQHNSRYEQGTKPQTEGEVEMKKTYDLVSFETTMYKPICAAEKMLRLERTMNMSEEVAKQAASSLAVLCFNSMGDEFDATLASFSAFLKEANNCTKDGRPLVFDSSLIAVSVPLQHFPAIREIKEVFGMAPMFGFGYGYTSPAVINLMNSIRRMQK